MKKITLALALGAVFGASRAEAALPTQFIAKQYSEVFGRIPDQGGWQGGVNFFTTNGCSQATLANWGSGAYTSTEFVNLGYGNQAKLLIAYRAILGREPDSASYTGYLNSLNAGTLSFMDVIVAFYNSPEFAALSSQICAATTPTQDPSYDWGWDAVISNPGQPASCSGSCTFAGGLASALNAKFASCTTVSLCQRSVTFASTAPNETVVIPPGKILTTQGAANQVDRYHYANMGRIVRTSNAGEEAVLVKSGGTLRNVWVSGQRDFVGHNERSVNITMNEQAGGYTGAGPSGTKVLDCKIDSPAGWSNLQSHDGNGDCTANEIRRNLITSYSSPHYRVGGAGQWSDGLSLGCQQTTVSANHIIDPSDVGIVIFGDISSPHTAQRSVVEDNWILSAGNSAFGAMTADPGGHCPTCPDPHPSFAGMRFTNNTLWTSSRTHFDVGISLGIAAWGDNTNIAGTTCTTCGATATGNTTGTQSMRANNAIIADGMLNQSIGSGQLNGFSFANTNTCPGTTTSNAKIIIHYSTHAKQINGIGATLGSAHACIEGDHPYP